MSDGQRRAEDSEDWKDYLDNNLNWEKAFDSLGASFTVRIILRRGLITEILQGLEQPENERHHDLENILKDCQSFRSDLNREKEKDVTQQIADINAVIDKVQELLDAQK